VAGARGHGAERALRADPLLPARQHRARGGLAIRGLILGFAAIAPLALIALWPYSPVAGIGVVAMSHMLILYPTLRANAQWLGPVITSFAGSGDEVWLTIDDGPAEDTRALLDAFDKRNVKATFFVKGTLAVSRADDIGEIVRRGHTVANHSHTHPSASFWCALPGRIAREIDDCNRALETLTGMKPRRFRAPVGMKNPFVHPALARRGMQLIGWSARAFDTVIDDPQEVVARLLPDVKPGAIILLHQGLPHSVRVMEHVIDALAARGYSFVIPGDAALRNTNR
jgi:peptidoglycan-N-acetylglucosamine deacetylase